MRNLLIIYIFLMLIACSSDQTPDENGQSNPQVDTDSPSSASESLQFFAYARSAESSQCFQLLIKDGILSQKAVEASLCNSSTALLLPNPINQLVSVTPILSGSIQCPNGGQKINVGIDKNSDGALNPNEYSTSSLVCNGVSPSSPLTLASQVIESSNLPVGDNECPTGGQKIQVGIDSDQDGNLSELETSSIAYVCNGSDGADGTNALIDNFYITKQRSGGNSISLSCPTNSRSDTLFYSDFYTTESNGEGKPYKTCVSETCMTDVPNGVKYQTANSGEDCVNSLFESVTCLNGSINIGDVCVNDSVPEECAVGQVDTTRGCEVPIDIQICTYNFVNDNQCVNRVENGILCGIYNEPLVVTAADHIVTCDLTFNDDVIIEAGANFLVDEYLEISFSGVSAIGTELNPISFRSSLGNPLGYWESLNINGKSDSFFYDIVDGYISGSRLAYVNISNVDGVKDKDIYFKDVYLSNISIDSASSVQIQNVLWESSILNIKEIDSAGYTATKSTLTDMDITTTGISRLYDIFVVNTVFKGESVGLYQDSFGLASTFNGGLNTVTGGLYFSEIVEGFSCGYGAYIYGNSLSSPLSSTCLKSSDNTDGVVSDKKGVHIMQDNGIKIGVQQDSKFRALLFDKYGFNNSPSLQWSATYVVDGVEFDYLTTWQGEIPTINFDFPEYYGLSVSSVDGSELIGKDNISVSAR